MKRIWLAARVVAVAALAVSLTATTVRAQRSGAAVTLSEDEQTWTLDNGVVKAMVAKASGDLVSIEFKGMEMLATRMNAQGKPDLEIDPPGATVNGLNRGMTDHQYGFWSHDAMGPRDTRPAVAKVTIDPKTNNGERAEVSVKGISKDRYMGTGPGASPNGQFASDIEIRWALGRGDSGVYTYSIFNHPADYPATSIGEARFCAKLNEFFDWLSAGTKYNKPYPKEQEKGEDKYVYTTIQSENPAFGWSSTTKNVGFYIINPSMEYMSGGPTKPEFLGHRDTNAVAAPCVLNYWRSSHYGGASVDVAAGEQWSKVVGPFMLFVTSGNDPQTMYDAAKAQAAREQAKWPFVWVDAPEYTPKSQRSTVKGQMVLNDSQMPMKNFTNLQVGLTHAAYPFLGVHFTRMVKGGVEAGPNAVLSFKREGYRKTDFNAREAWDTLSYPGFWRLAAKYWRMGAGEFHRSFSKPAFVRALQRLLPDLRAEDLHPAEAGVRAQAIDPTGALVDDFSIQVLGGIVHVLNAPSPAATASLPIGRAIADEARRHFEL
jgi:hypothetical protein